MNKKIAFIGCGNMGEALLKGILEKGLFKPSQVTATDRRKIKRNFLKVAYGVRVTSSNMDAAKMSDIILLAVKPQNIPDVLRELKQILKNKLIISIAAGITTDFIRKKTGAKNVVRAMPNTPALAGCGITAVSAAKGARAADIKIADRIFGCVGEVVSLNEKYMDTVTAASGSGPAYFFLLMEEMIKAASSLGLKKEIARRLVLKTATGAAMLQEKTGIDPSTLRQNVTSKGGTTEAALKVFKKNGFEKTVREAIKAAKKKAGELSK